MNTQASLKTSEPGSEKEIIQGLVKKARAAMALFANADQARVDEAVTALAWAIYEPVRAKELAELLLREKQKSKTATPNPKRKENRLGFSGGSGEP